MRLWLVIGLNESGCAESVARTSGCKARACHFEGTALSISGVGTDGSSWGDTDFGVLPFTRAFPLSAEGSGGMIVSRRRIIKCETRYRDRYTRPAQQFGLLCPHIVLILRRVVIVAQQMQGSVNHQQHKLVSDSVPQFVGLMYCVRV